MDTTQRTEKHRLISALDSFTLLGLSRLGEPDERVIAREELDARGHLPVPPGSPARLIKVCDELDQVESELVDVELQEIFSRVTPSACLFIAAVGEERSVARLDGAIAAEQESDRRLAARR